MLGGVNVIMLNNNVKLIVSWLLVIIWAILIFTMSSMNSNESNTKSKDTLSEIVEKTVETTNEMKITDKHPSENRMQDFINKYNYLFRKIAHVTEYFVFSILLLIALKNSGVVGKKIFIIAIGICFLYACGDEYHQTFVSGRTGHFRDTLIDTSGGIVGIFVILLINKIKKLKSEKIKSKSTI